MAPRFDFSTYRDLLLQHYWYCREDVSMNTPKGYLKNRISMYKQLYGTTELNEPWYLWNFLNMSNDMKQILKI